MLSGTEKTKKKTDSPPALLEALRKSISLKGLNSLAQGSALGLIVGVEPLFRDHINYIAA